MKKYEITFPLNNKETILLYLQEPLELVDLCYEEYIFLSYNKNKHLLAEGPIYYNMQQLIKYLKKTINNQLPLHSSITLDIGYLLNEYHISEDNFIMYNFPSGISSWIGYKYHVWEAASHNIRLITWIYNKPDGSIIFEVTPFYPYMYCEPTEEPNYISYNEWIKTYKPYLIRELPTTTAQEWLKQAEYIIQTIEANVEKWKNIQ
ncbi:MAG TPA: hypothetical protein VLB80_03105 [Candidatus Babeliales bacterium]|nr:hypothetical protein [Candidatus Babeliales bacterium]